MYFFYPGRAVLLSEESL